MVNRILDLVVVNHRLDPVATELRVYVKLADITPATQIRGQFLGPRCAYASTIEIAYPLKEVSRGDYLEFQARIPEPSWWDPESPFLYKGVLQLWQEDAMCDHAAIHHGIRRVQLTPKGLRVNGLQYLLRGRTLTHLSESDAQQLRARGINTILTNLTDAGLDVWRAADRLGFFVLGMSDEPTRFVQWQHEISGHASALGWIFNRTEFGDVQASLTGHGREVRPLFFGVNTSATGELPNADFLFCHERELGWLEEIALPKIVFAERLPNPLPPRPDVIGWVQTS